MLPGHDNCSCQWEKYEVTGIYQADYEEILKLIEENEIAKAECEVIIDAQLIIMTEQLAIAEAATADAAENEASADALMQKLQTGWLSPRQLLQQRKIWPQSRMSNRP
jgi:hypothetical protein